MRPIHLLLYICLATILAACSCQRGRKATDADSQPKAIDTVPMLVMQIQKCSKLYTAEYDIHKIITHDDTKRLKGTFLNQDFDVKLPLGDRKIAIPMNAKLKAYIDFAEFSEKNISRTGKKITITLPDPKVTLTSSKIDQKGIKEFVDITRSRFTDAEMADLERQGRSAVIAAIPRLGIIESAQENAARVLIPMIEQMGYRESDITITFRKEFGSGDINHLLDKSAAGK